MAAGDLPVGFTVDQAPAAAAPTGGLPPGFQLDAPVDRGTPLPANAGVGKLGSNLLGIPVDAVENVMNLTRAAQGAVAGGVGKLTGTDTTAWMPPLLEGSPGGSQWLQEQLRRTGLPGLSPDNPTPQSEVGTAQYDFVARGGVVPGGAIPALGSIVAEKIGGPDWAPVGAMAPSGATAAWNAARAPGMAAKRTHETVRDATWKDAQEAGYKAPPSAVNPTFLGNRAESVAGKAALNQQAIDENQVVTDSLARRAAKLPEGTPLTMEVLDRRINQAAEPYRQVSALSPLAAKALERLRQARADARAQWDHYEVSKDPKAQSQAKQHDQTAEALENVLEREAQRHGQPGLIPQLREARADIAKVHDVKRALNKGDGHVDADVIGRAFDRNAPLSGELLTIGRFANAFPAVTRPAARNPTPGVSALEPNMAMGLGVAGNAANMGWMPMGVPLLGSPTRGMLLSDIYQRNFARPNYDPAMLPEGSLQSLARTAYMENERARK